MLYYRIILSLFENIPNKCEDKKKLKRINEYEYPAKTQFRLGPKHIRPSSQDMVRCSRLGTFVTRLAANQTELAYP